MEIVDFNASSIAVSSMPVWWPDDVIFGILLGILGICGAAIMVYIGEWDKLMGKSARIVEIENEIEMKRKIANKITDPKEVDIRKKFEDMINEDEDRLDRERKEIITRGLLLYLFIGGVVAAILADSMIEAVGFGAGWTGLIGVFGIKKDSELKEKSRITEMLDMEENMKAIITKTTKTTEEAYYRGLSDAVERIAKAENKNAEEILKVF